MITIVANKSWSNIKQDDCPKCKGPLVYLDHANSFFVLQVEYFCPNCHEVVLVFPDEMELQKHEGLMARSTKREL